MVFKELELTFKEPEFLKITRFVNTQLFIIKDIRKSGCCLYSEYKLVGILIEGIWYFLEIPKKAKVATNRLIKFKVSEYVYKFEEVDKATFTHIYVQNICKFPKDIRNLHEFIGLA